jgi:hypothetical protein
VAVLAAQPPESLTRITRRVTHVGGANRYAAISARYRHRGKLTSIAQAE